MPANRMLHKRALAGDRTNALTHLEWRVWTVYEMAADDFGVMRYHEEAWITAHPCLGREKARALRAAIDRVVASSLVGQFKADNGLSYVYQRDWQDWQRIEWPSLTTAPRVPDALLLACSDLTQRLFTAWPGGKRLKVEREKVSTDLPSDSRSDLPSSPERNTCELATTREDSHSHHGSSGNGKSPEKTESNPPVAEFLEGYRERYQRVTGGMLPLVWPPKDYAIATELLKTWPLARLLDMAELYMHRTDKDVAGKPKTLAWFKPMAPWADTRLREAGR